MMAIKGQKFKIVSFSKSFCLIYAQKAFSWHEKIIEGLKAGQGYQRPQRKRVKKSHFINHYCLIYADKPSFSLKKSKAQKAYEGHQMSQCKKVKKAMKGH